MKKGKSSWLRQASRRPAIKAIAESADFIDGNPPASKKFLLDAVNYGCFVPDNDHWQQALSASIIPSMDKIWAGTKKPAEIMPAVAKEVTKIINEE